MLKLGTEFHISWAKCFLYKNGPPIEYFQTAKEVIMFQLLLKYSAASKATIRSLAILPILALPLLACQSTNNKLDEETTSRLIDTKLKIIQSKLDRGKALEAQFEAEPILKKFPNNPKVLVAMGFTDLALQNNSRAISYLKKAYSIEKSPANALNLSSAYIASKNYNKALKVLDEGIAIAEKTKYRKRVRLHHNKGHIYEKKGLTDRAIIEYKQALYYSPGYILTIKNLAQIYEKQRKFEEAKMLYQRYTYACSACYEPVKKLVDYYVKEKNFLSAKSLLSTFTSNNLSAKSDKILANRQLKRVERYRRHYILKKKKANAKRYSKRMKKNRTRKKQTKTRM